VLEKVAPEAAVVTTAVEVVAATAPVVLEVAQGPKKPADSLSSHPCLHSGVYTLLDARCI
jgi:hypothetical protein